MNDTLTTSLPCPKCHALIILPVIAIKAKCRECGTVSVVSQIEKEGQK